MPREHVFAGGVANGPAFSPARPYRARDAVLPETPELELSRGMGRTARRTPSASLCAPPSR